jgi:hypothetical protein
MSNEEGNVNDNHPQKRPKKLLDRAKILHEKDLADGYGRVYLPYALARKYPHADSEWGWHYVFPAKGLSRDPRSGIMRRHP